MPESTRHLSPYTSLAKLCAALRLAVIIFFPSLASLCAAQVQPARPKITGIAHVRLYAANLYASRDFYRVNLGFGSGTAGCLGIANPCFTVNGRQHIELLQIPGGTPDNLLAEVAFATDDVAKMRRYLIAHGKAPIGPQWIHCGEDGEHVVTDPQGIQHAYGDRLGAES